jgi:hypothetical protein
VDFDDEAALRVISIENYAGQTRPFLPEENGYDFRKTHENDQNYQYLKLARYQNSRRENQWIRQVGPLEKYYDDIRLLELRKV